MLERRIVADGVPECRAVSPSRRPQSSSRPAAPAGREADRGRVGPLRRWCRLRRRWTPRTGTRPGPLAGQTGSARLQDAGRPLLQKSTAASARLSSKRRLAWDLIPPKSQVDNELLGIDNADLNLFSVNELCAQLDKAGRVLDGAEVAAFILRNLPAGDATGRTMSRAVAGLLRWWNWKGMRGRSKLPYWAV